MTLPRRTFLKAALTLIAAPAIVRVASIMPVRGIIQDADFAFSGFYSLIPAHAIGYAGRLWWDDGAQTICYSAITDEDLYK